MTRSSTWMIPVLLLALFVSFLPSTAARCRGLSEFNKNLKILGDQAMNCPENCSSVQTDSTCKCLHLNVTEKCDSPDYFINGLNSLRSLHTNNSSLIQIQHMITMLEKMPSKCLEINFCPPSKRDSYESVISPGSFYKKLEVVIQFFNSQQSQKST